LNNFNPKTGEKGKMYLFDDQRRTLGAEYLSHKVNKGIGKYL
jgi:hypothetical protein